MAVPSRYIFLACALMAAAVFLAAPRAFADCYGCSRPPPACQHNCQPAPPTPPPPCHGCAPPAVVIPPPQVAPPPRVVVGHVGAQAQASATSISIAHARSGDVVVRTGGGVAGAAYAGVSASAGVSAAALSVADAGGAIELLERSALIEAVCVDAAGLRYHAGQTFDGRDVRAAYAGELFRCWVGTRLTYVRDDGAAGACAPGEALWYGDGALSCRRQTRSDGQALLHRFGPGQKMVRLRGERPAAAETQMTMDGGVGQGVW